VYFPWFYLAVLCRGVTPASLPPDRAAPAGTSETQDPAETKLGEVSFAVMVHPVVS
jgi:hypothetical protein